MAYEIKHGRTMLTESEYEKFSKGELIFGESDSHSDVIATFDTITEAEKALKSYRCTYEKSSVNSLYYIEEYGFAEIDDCGCATIYLADEPTTEYAVYDDQLTEVFKSEDRDDAERYIEKAEHEADERGEYISLTIEQRYKNVRDEQIGE